MADTPTPADKLRLMLVSAEAELLDELFDEVTLPAREGEMGVFPGHAAFLGTLQPGVVVYRTGSSEQRVAVSGGFCEILDGGVRVLVDAASMGSDIDTAAVQSELAEAQRAADDAGTEDLLAAQDRVKALTAQLDVAR